MSTIADDLLKIRFFRQIAANEVKKAAAYWSRTELSPGELLWQEGTKGSELCAVVSGELSVSSRGIEVGRIQEGELAGEVAVMLADDVRTASVRAIGPATLLTLPQSGLRRLQEQENPVYEALADAALVALVRRIRATDLRIARLALGDRPAPVKREVSMLARMWKALRPGTPAPPCPPLRPLLGALPGSTRAPTSSHESLESAFVPMAVEEGQILFLEGEQGDAAYILASGAMDILRHVRNEKAELLTTLAPGAIFGINSLIESGARTASCVASTPSWVYRISAQDFRRLTGPSNRWWRTTVASVLAEQLRCANDAIHRIVGNLDETSISPDDESSFRGLMRASGYVEALSIQEKELDEVEFTLDEAQRNRRNR